MDKQILQFLNTYHHEMIAFCQQLIQIPSVNGVDDEIAAAEMIARGAARLGLYAEIVGDDPRRPNVIVSTAESGETGLLLLGHLDTVPPGDSARWAFPPFSGTLADGRIYGRGAVDTKGGMAAALYALAALKHTPGALAAGRAQLICVPDEESGATGILGIRYLAAQGLLHGRGAIYAYSGDRILLGHRGLARFRLVCTGQAIHTGSEAWQDRSAGANAVTGMAWLLLALEEIETGFSPVRYFEGFRTMFTPGTIIQGGSSINIVPDHCEALLDVRLTPEYDLARVEALLQAAIARVARDRLVFSYDVLNHAPAAISDESAPIFSILEAVITQVKGHKPERAVAGPANEGYLLIAHDIPTVCGLGPTGANAHADNEYVEVQGLYEAAAIYALAARRLSQVL